MDLAFDVEVSCSRATSSSKGVSSAGPQGIWRQKVYVVTSRVRGCLRRVRESQQVSGGGAVLPSRAWTCLFFILLGFGRVASAERLSYCRPNNMVSALAYIAESEGYFKEQGLDFQFPVATNAKICQDLMLAGKADYMTGAEGPFTYLAASHPPVKILAFAQSNYETSVFARRDRGISTFTDLKNKRVAYLPGTVSYFFLSRLLERLHFSKSDIKLTPMQPPAMAPALVGGAVDAFIMWEPWGSNALSQLGTNGVQLADSTLYHYETLLIASDEILKKNPETAPAVIKALLRAEEFIHQQPDRSIEILSKAISIDAAVLRSIWGSYKHELKLDEVPIRLMTDNFRYLKADDENFKEVPIPDFLSFVDDQYLRKIAPERVQMLPRPE